jgi:hypothetical protein
VTVAGSAAITPADSRTQIAMNVRLYFIDGITGGKGISEKDRTGPIVYRLEIDVK